jgi:hypothetical protein
MSSDCHQDSPGAFIAAVETIHVDRGMVTNDRSKQATERLSVVQCQGQSPEQQPNINLQSTHLTPMREGDAFGDL